MSVITDMVLITGFDEHAAVERLNAWCHSNDGRQQQFARLDEDAAGGVKVFTGEVWAMAGNYFLWRDLAAALPTFGWRWPDEVVLVVNHEHDEETHVFRGGGRRAGWEPAEQPEAAPCGAHGEGQVRSTASCPLPVGHSGWHRVGPGAWWLPANEATQAELDDVIDLSNEDIERLIAAQPPAEPASGGVVEPSGPLTAEEANPITPEVYAEHFPERDDTGKPLTAEEATPDCGLPGLAELLVTDEEIEADAARTARLPKRGVLRPFDGCGPEHTYRGSCEYAKEAGRG